MVTAVASLAAGALTFADGSAWAIADIVGAASSDTPGSFIVSRCSRQGKPTKATGVLCASADVRPRKLTRHVVIADSPEASAGWIRDINAAARPGGVGRRFLCIVNPKSGPGGASQLFEHEARPVLEAAGASLDVRVTCSAGDGTRWAREADINSYDGILACGGDGTLHEVLRGITTRADCGAACAKLTLGHLPGGSGNAVAHNVSCVSGEASDMVAGAFLAVKGVSHAVDVALTWDQNGRVMPAMLMVEWGLISDIDFGSEWLRVLGGARFTVTAVQRIWGLRGYPVALEILPSQGAVADPEEFYRIGAASAEAGVAPRSALLASELVAWERVEGNLAVCVACNMPWVDRTTPLAPSARLDDGALTVVTSSDGLGRVALAREFLRLDTGGHLETGLVKAQRAAAIRLVPKVGSASAIGVDGEIAVDVGAPGASLDAVLYPGVVKLYAAPVPEPPRSKL